MKDSALTPGPDATPYGGTMGAMVRAFRWDSTPLGPAADWPQALRTVIDIMLGSNQPMFVTWGPDRTLLYNDGYAPMLGARHPDALGRPFPQVWSEAWPELSPLFETVDAGGSVHMDDLTLTLHRNGYPEEAHFAFSYTPVRDADGRVAGMLCPCSEITAQVRSSARLRESEERLRAIVEGADDIAILTMDADGVITDWSQGAQTILGYTREEAVGLPAALIFTADDRARLADWDELTTAAREGCAPDVRWHLRKDGSSVFLNGSMRALRDADGAVSGFLKVARDDTDRHRYTEALVENERRFREMADAAPVILWITDPDGVCTYLNKPWYAYTGQSKDEAEGFGWLDATHPGDKVRSGEVFLEANARRAPFYVEYRLRRADGSYSWAIDTALPRFAEDGSYLGYVGAVIDIGERKRAEETLLASEARLRTLTDAVPAFVWFATPEGSVAYYNARWYAYTGLTESESVDAGWVSALHPDDVADASAAWEEARARGYSYVVECRYRRVDGTYRWYVVRAEPVRDEHGGITGWFGTSTDIHDRKLAEAAQADSEARLRAITDSVDQMIWSTLPDGFHDYFNQRWYDYTGVPEGSTDGEAWNGVFHPDDQPRSREVWTRSLETGEPYHIEYRLRRRDGQYRWVLGRAQAIRDEDGRITRWFGTCTDIQEIVEAREVLARSRAALEGEVQARTAELDRLWEVSEDLLVVVDYEGRLLRVNPSWTRVLGYDEATLLSRPYAEILYSDELARIADTLTEMRESGRPVRLENRVLSADGSWRSVSWRLSPEAGGERLYGVGRDITAEKEAAASLERLESQLRQAQKMEAVGQLTGGVAHDFNNLLQIVVGNLELLDRSLPTDATRQRRSVDNAMSGAKRAVTLTQRLLAFSRRQPLEPKPVAANKLVGGMSELLSRALGETIHVETVLAAGLWRIEVDPNQLENAILNLAVNARDAMTDGGRLTIETANTRLDESYVQQNVEVTSGQYVVICVSDTGTGMDKATAARVFEPFFTTKEVGKGTGLGLSQVYGFVKQSGGHVKIYSERGDHQSCGTTVKIYLPRYLGPGQEEEVEVEAAAPGGGPEETILVVEDDPDVRAYTVEVLSELGYHVLEAGEAHAALKLLRDAAVHCDLLFTDVVLPGGINGEELAAAAHEARPGLKVLFTTGYARNAIVHQGRLDPGVRLITKPFTYADLAARVRDVLDEAPA